MNPEHYQICFIPKNIEVLFFILQYLKTDSPSDLGSMNP